MTSWEIREEGSGRLLEVRTAPAFCLPGAYDVRPSPVEPGQVWSHEGADGPVTFKILRWEIDRWLCQIMGLRVHLSHSMITTYCELIREAA